MVYAPDFVHLQFCMWTLETGTKPEPILTELFYIMAKKMCWYISEIKKATGEVKHCHVGGTWSVLYLVLEDSNH